MTHADYLAGLDDARLAVLLRERPDVLVEPAPATFGELAWRLNGVGSLVPVVTRLNRDQDLVLRAAAGLEQATTGELARRLRATPEQVDALVEELCGLGVVWREGPVVRVVKRLAAQLDEMLQRFPPADTLARRVRVDSLRTVLAAHDLPTNGLKAELAAAVTRLLGEPTVVARALAELPEVERAHLLRMLNGNDLLFPTPMGPARTLVERGLALSDQYGQATLPREVAREALWQLTGARLSGRPVLPEAAEPIGVPGEAGRAAAESAFLALTTMLDEARRTPLAALKKGGIGSRERTRLAKLGIVPPELWIDVAAEAELLVPGVGGYRPGPGYGAWREAEPAERWASIALAWWVLDVAPTDRREPAVPDDLFGLGLGEELDEIEAPPPLEMTSAAGRLRRALLRAVAGGRSLAAAAREIDWFCPGLDYDPHRLRRKIEVALTEAELLGVVAGDRLTPLGEQLVGAGDVDELAAAVRDLLPHSRGTVVLQSDLTAVVSGQPSARAAALLAAAAVPESRGAATIHRFTPASVRAALDEGWTVEQLRAELAAVSERELPQPLDYLLNDIGRRHGVVRVRAVHTVLVGPEAEISEIAHTRSLGGLGLRVVAPTVLTSQVSPEQLLTALRKAGFAPVQEDDDGTVVLSGPSPAAPAGKGAERGAGRKPARTSGAEPAASLPPARPRLAAAELVARLRAAPEEAPVSSTYQMLRPLAPTLDPAQLALLADAVDRQRPVLITYRNAAGNLSDRVIQPEECYGRWIHAWCYLRNDAREFSIGGIESVDPA